MLSRAGRGPYLHLRSPEDAEQISRRFDELLGVAIDHVRLTLTAPWYFEVERAYLFASTTAGEAEPQYLGPSGRIVFPFRLRACAEGAIEPVDSITARLDYETPGAGAAPPVTLVRTLGELELGGSARLGKSFAVLAYAEALRSLDGPRLRAAFDRMRTENDALSDAQLGEILSLLPQHPGFSN
jgi:hypothetical protein